MYATLSPNLTSSILLLVLMSTRDPLLTSGCIDSEIITKGRNPIIMPTRLTIPRTTTTIQSTVKMFDRVDFIRVLFMLLTSPEVFHHCGHPWASERNRRASYTPLRSIFSTSSVIHSSFCPASPCSFLSWCHPSEINRWWWAQGWERLVLRPPGGAATVSEPYLGSETWDIIDHMWFLRVFLLMNHRLVIQPWCTASPMNTRGGRSALTLLFWSSLHKSMNRGLSQPQDVVVLAIFPALFYDFCLSYINLWIGVVLNHKILWFSAVLRHFSEVHRRLVLSYINLWMEVVLDHNILWFWLIFA